MRGACQISHTPDYVRCSMQQLRHLISQHNKAAVQWLLAALLCWQPPHKTAGNSTFCAAGLKVTFFSFRADLRDVTGRTTANSVLSHPVGLMSTTYFTFFLKGRESPR